MFVNDRHLKPLAMNFKFPIRTDLKLKLMQLNKLRFQSKALINKL